MVVRGTGRVHPRAARRFRESRCAPRASVGLGRVHAFLPGVGARRVQRCGRPTPAAAKRGNARGPPRSRPQCAVAKRRAVAGSHRPRGLAAGAGRALCEDHGSQRAAQCRA
jgi:hypothetical protein